MAWLYLHATLQGSEPEARGLALFRIEGQPGWFVRLPAGEPVGVGRREPLEGTPVRWLRVPCRTVSRHQCTVEWASGRYTLTDRHSAGGTFVNGERAARDAVLCHGDVVSAGELRMTFLERLPGDGEPL